VLTEPSILKALRSAIPGVPWVAQPGRSMAYTWRIFDGFIDGVKYEVKVLAWWANGCTLREFDYAMLIDGHIVVSRGSMVFETFVKCCAEAILREAREAQVNSNNFLDALQK
jgi:hypothetical protein